MERVRFDGSFLNFSISEALSSSPTSSSSFSSCLVLSPSLFFLSLSSSSTCKQLVSWKEGRVKTLLNSYLGVLKPALQGFLKRGGKSRTVGVCADFQASRRVGRGGRGRWRTRGQQVERQLLTRGQRRCKREVSVGREVGRR